MWLTVLDSRIKDVQTPKESHWKKFLIMSFEEREFWYFGFQIEVITSSGKFHPGIPLPTQFRQI